MSFNSKGGFTTGELLVTLSIFVIIIAVVIGYLYQGSAMGHDNRRKNNISQIGKAIDSYYDENGYLPLNRTGACTYISNPINNYGTAFKKALAPYLENLPLDPVNGGKVGDYLYVSKSNFKGKYVLCANMEQATGENYDYKYCPGGTIYNYCVDNSVEAL